MRLLLFPHYMLPYFDAESTFAFHELHRRILQFFPLDFRSPQSLYLFIPYISTLNLRWFVHTKLDDLWNRRNNKCAKSEIKLDFFPLGIGILCGSEYS